jgi:hypothetical protein
LASSATSEQFAFRFYAVGRGNHDFHAVRLGIVLVVTKDPNSDSFPGEGKGDLHDPSIVTGNSISQVRDVLNLQNEFVMIGIGLV